MSFLHYAENYSNHQKNSTVDNTMCSEPNSTRPTIADLPNEMLEHIFSYLELEERLTATRVCRRWHGTALQWRDIRLAVYSADESDLATFLASERPYRHLVLNNDHFAAQLITKFSASLKSLCITNVESWDWLSSISGLPDLRSMYIKCNYRYHSLRDVPLSQPCSSLRWLTIEEIGSDVFPALNRFISATFPALEHLEVDYYTGVFRLSNLAKLEHLKLIGYNEIDDGLLLDIKALPNLCSIILTGRRLECDYPEDVLHSDQIRSVEIGTDDPLSDEELLKLTEVFPGMTSFCFSRWTLCSESGIETARRRLPNCTFDVESGKDSMELGSGSESEDSSSESDSC